MQEANHNSGTAPEGRDGHWSRRRWLAAAASGALGAALPVSLLADDRILRSVPSSGEQIPALGLGSWLTFDVRKSDERRAQIQAIIDTFFLRGGAMIDSSPMYGLAQEAIGDSLQRLAPNPSLFSATKVWIPGAAPGKFQMENALDLWGLSSFDLLHVHNMVDWEVHLPWMKEWQREGRIRYTGITTSHGRRHGAMEGVLPRESFDFVQLTYNLTHRQAEERLLPLAADHGAAVVINRPLDGGRLFGPVANKPLPPWAAEIGCKHWSQYFLKFVISHPAVTCAIPATSQLDHLEQNMGALYGPLPDQSMRQEMVRYYEAVAD